MYRWKKWLLKSLSSWRLCTWSLAAGLAYQAAFSPKEVENLQLKEFEKSWQQRTGDGGRELTSNTD